MEEIKKEINEEELKKVYGGVNVGEFGYGDDTKCSFRYAVDQELYYNPNVVYAYRCKILDRYSFKNSRNQDTYSPIYKIVLLYNNEILSDVLESDLVKNLSIGVSQVY